MTEMVPPGWRNLMTECWQEIPDKRPSTLAIKRAILAQNNGRSMKLVDNMILRLENYTKNLENIVEDRCVNSSSYLINVSNIDHFFTMAIK